LPESSANRRRLQAQHRLFTLRASVNTVAPLALDSEQSNLLWAGSATRGPAGREERCQPVRLGGSRLESRPRPGSTASGKGESAAIDGFSCAAQGPRRKTEGSSGKLEASCQCPALPLWCGLGSRPAALL